MASGKSTTARNLTLDWLLNVGTPTRPSAPRVAFTTDNPTAADSGTGITPSGTYSAGGSAVTFAAASGGATTGHSGALSWTPSGASWTIEGWVIHQAGAAHPSDTQHVYWGDTFGAAGSLSVPDGVTLEIAAGGISLQET